MNERANPQQFIKGCSLAIDIFLVFVFIFLIKLEIDVNTF